VAVGWSGNLVTLLRQLGLTFRLRSVLPQARWSLSLAATL
jgi:hypothetical protein